MELKKLWAVSEAGQASSKQYDRFRTMVIGGFLLFLAVACGLFFTSAASGGGLVKASGATATATLSATKAGPTAAPTILIIYRDVTAVPTVTPVPSQTARIVYLRQATSTPENTPTPGATATAINGVWRDNGCWRFNLYGVESVFVDKTPVAPAYGGVVACGREVTIK
ncbi:MAG TPA: hypothetical protein V6C97_27175 [Oculatellaceae cyanobacterium]